MRADSPRWVRMGPAASPDEAHALELLRTLLPDAPTTQAWVNLTFVDNGGRLSEVDVLLLHRTGLFLLELKGWHGAITGDQQQWQIARTGRPAETVRNPLLTTHSKAQRLATLLKDTHARARVPYVQAITVLHGTGTTVTLPETAAAHTYALDGAGVTGLPDLSELLDRPVTDERNRVDGPRAKALIALVEAAGITAAPKTRMVGRYRIESTDPLAEGPGWVDVRAAHPDLTGEHRRVRLYDVPPDASTARRAQIQHAAQREYYLTKGLGHPGVVAALEFLALDSGPVLIFDDDAGSTPLSRWLDEHREQLNADERLAVIRDLAEVLRYAHSRGMTHRALTPEQVHVVERPGQPRLITVRDWQTGRAEGSVSESGTPRPTALRGTTALADLATLSQPMYLAPEINTDLPGGVALDVYGLGAITYLLLTDAPPPRQVAVPDTAGLDMSAVLDGISEELLELVRAATEPDVMLRTPDVDTFLRELTAAETALRAPDPEPVTDPLTAQVTDVLGDWIVEDRLGSGSTGLALLVSDGLTDSVSQVLKVAHDTSKATRLRAEAATLAKLDHPRVVRLLRESFTLNGRTCVLLEDAGRPTLGQRVREQGRLTLEQLERFGADLFEAVGYLTRQGVLHRDLKPDNLGIRPDPADRRPRLELFDFSLAHEPPEAIGSGTRPYLDPFLGPPHRPRYDSAAERFALAATLFEMATGAPPTWGDGASDPASIADEATLTPAMFEPALAAGLREFFATALARDAGRRHDSLDAMATAWQVVFAPVSVAADTEDEQAVEARDALAAAVELTTPITAAGLSARAVSALTRPGLDVETVDELLAVSPVAINQMPGIGVATRREIQARRRQWATRLAVPITTVLEEPAGRGVEDLRDRLVPQPNGRNADTVALARALVGSTDRTASDPWATWARATEAAGLTGDAAAAATVALQTSWGRSPLVAELRTEVLDALEALQGVAAVDEVAARLLARHGSIADGPDRVAHALPLVRAVVEATTETPVPASRGTDPDSPVLLATPGTAAGDAEARLAGARQLAAAADTAVATGVLLTGPESSALTETFRDQVAITDPRRLVALAAAASTSTAASSRGELYARGLAPELTVRTVLATAAARLITVDGLRRRVAARFPAAAALPERPVLDDLVRAAAPALRWDGAAYVPPSHSASLLHTSTRHTTTDPVAVAPDEIDARLTQSLRTAGRLVLGCNPQWLDRAPAALAARHGMVVLDVTAELLRALRAEADTLGIDWGFLLGVDAQPAGSTDRNRLRDLVDRALDRFWPTIATSPDPLLLTELAPISRYDAVARLAALTDLTTALPAARWLLVPHRPSDGPPTLQGVPVPLPADGWLDLPSRLLSDSTLAGTLS